MNHGELTAVKRNLTTFSDILSRNLSRPKQHLIMDLIYGISKKQAPVLTEIARGLEEETDLIHTVKRLSRMINNLSNVDIEQINNNYLKTIDKKCFKDEMLVIVDNSDIAKPYGKKFEALTKIRDGSTKLFVNGFVSSNFIISTPETKHPIPIYSHIFSSKEENYISENKETYEGMDRVKEIIGDYKYTYVCDRGYDCNDIFEYIIKQEQDFIIRLRVNRNVIYCGETYKDVDLVNADIKGNINFKSTIKGTEYKLLVHYAEVKLPAFGDQKFYMVIVEGYGKKPMLLLTTKKVETDAQAEQILKSYITRWRIEENFRVQKQEYGLEKVRTMTLKSMRIITSLIGYIIGKNSMILESKSIYSQIVVSITKEIKGVDKIKFKLYRFARGIAQILSSDSTGIKLFKRIKHKVNEKFEQLSLELF